MINLWYEGLSQGHVRDIGYGNKYCGVLRAAHTQRLAQKWGYWSEWSNSSCQVAVPPRPQSCYTYDAGTNSLGVGVNGSVGVPVQVSRNGSSWFSPGMVSGLTPDTYYTFYARHNANGWVSGSVSCGGKTLNPPPSAWGDPAGCPGIAVYVTGGSSWTHNVRRYNESTCQGRMVATEAGAVNGAYPYPGYVIATYQWRFAWGWGAPWQKVSGDAIAPVGLPSTPTGIGFWY